MLHPVGDITGAYDKLRLTEHLSLPHSSVQRQCRFLQNPERGYHGPADRIRRHILLSPEIPLQTVMQVRAIDKTENFPALRPHRAAEQGNAHQH